ncbi:DUF1822 family protein [Nodosilinea sp. LEGE 07088]|uniref:DUF1822 family protein n=1 Tax=Nodosilinea sp. LEGE 07088 TaxID=2777968 RepID=UPI00187E3E6A|nr:DUF1822 family protein [Nodosilinea sp. LEGE 07088]MBE9136684.1 DUF1822 family protein [Nodosilinea sp. LEGE 07088]
MSPSREFQDFEFDPLLTATVMLPPAAIDWAIQVSQAEPVSDVWSDFLRALSLKGFEQWLAAGALDLAMYYDPEQAPPVGVNCRVGDFRLCLIAQGSLSDEVVRIAKSTVEVPDQFAHLYVLLEVREEMGQVTILSSLRRDRLLTLQQASPLGLNPDDTYSVPIHAFDAAPEELLLYLNCLNPEQLASPAAGTALAAVEGDPSAESPSPATSVINVGRWLQNQLGAIADQLAWTLLPPLPQLEAAMAMRSLAADIKSVLTELSPAVTLPPNARGAYTNCQAVGLPFRLYAFTWTLLETDVPEWSLLLLLGPVENSQLPPGMGLLIRDNNSVLVEQTLEPDSAATYLYGQVVGRQDEAFTVTVELPNGSTLNWPPFVFGMGEG